MYYQKYSYIANMKVGKVLNFAMELAPFYENEPVNSMALCDYHEPA